MSKSKKDSSPSVDVPQASSTFKFAYYNEHVGPVYKFLVGVTHKMENSTSILLTAGTGANVNLMNIKTFDMTFGNNRKLLQPTPLQMET